MLTDVLRLLTSQYKPAEVVVLIQGRSRSMAAPVVAGSLGGSVHADGIRWLKHDLGGAASRVYFGSISKLKRNGANAVIITDVVPEAQSWAE